MKNLYAKELKKKVIDGYKIDKDEALNLIDLDIEELSTCADEIRDFFCGNKFDVCSIMNAKSGGCSENCKYCAQSCQAKAKVEISGLVGKEIALKYAIKNYNDGILRFDMVTAGRALNDEEVEKLCENCRFIKSNCPISLCSSNGLLTLSQLQKLKNAGVSRYHNNLETSRRFFPNICTSHTYDDKIETIKNAQKLNFSICSGGIFGIGENWEDRIDMAFELLNLGIKSNPINFLNPVKGTYFEDAKPLSKEEARKIVAIYRFILYDSALKIAGGRALYDDNGRSFFKSGANSTLSGNMLTTKGIAPESDFLMIKELGFKIEVV